MTDPTITIAGLRAKVSALIDHLETANQSLVNFSCGLSKMEAHAAEVEAERDALAAQLTEVRAELVQLGGADLARDAAEDRAARLDADLAKVRAELAAAPKVCAIHSYALEGPCMTCGAPWPGAEKALRQERIEGMEKMRRISAAVGCPNSVEEVVEAVAAIKSDLASERARLAACQTRITGLEQAANERSAEVARLTARVAELEARPVLTHEILSAAIKKARKVPPYIARQAADEYMPHLGPVTLPAQDRAEELCRAYHERAADMDGHMVGRWQYHGPESQAICTEAMERALASLGAPPTSRDTVRDAMERAAEGFGGSDGVFNAAGFSTALMHAAGLSGAVDGRLVRAILAGRCDVQDRGDGHYQITPPPTSPPAARPVFAGVSVEELKRAYLDVADGDVIPGLRAVLARLEVSLVTPVDPREFALVMIMRDLTDDNGDVSTTAVEAAARYALTARGIPVTPEVGK